MTVMLMIVVCEGAIWSGTWLLMTDCDAGDCGA